MGGLDVFWRAKREDSKKEGRFREERPRADEKKSSEGEALHSWDELGGVVAGFPTGRRSAMLSSPQQETLSH